MQCSHATSHSHEQENEAAYEQWLHCIVDLVLGIVGLCYKNEEGKCSECCHNEGSEVGIENP